MRYHLPLLDFYGRRRRAIAVNENVYLVTSFIIIIIEILDAGHHPLYPDRGSRAVALLYSQTEQADSSRFRLTLIRKPSHLARTRLIPVMHSVAGTFVPKNFRSRERKFHRVELSFPGTIVPWNFRSQERKFHGIYIPWNFRSLELSFPGTFAPWNFRSLNITEY